MFNKNYLEYWELLYSKGDYFGRGPTKLAKYAENILKNQSIHTMLEIGCGQGRDALHFASKGYDVHAFDLSHNAIEFIEKRKKELGLNNLKLKVHDTSQIFSYTANQFDFIYSNLALQFFDLPTMKKIIDNVAKVMKSESSFVFSTKKEGDKYYKKGTKINENAYEHKGVIRYFYDKKTLLNSLEEKFEVIEIEEDKHINLDSTVSVWWKICAKKI
jgi:ubiquinone/menaquinone biosynthesis C-methylase UbiE